MWCLIHLRNPRKLKSIARRGGIGHHGLELFHCVPRLAHSFKGHPDRHHGRGGAEAAAGGGQAVGDVRDGHHDLFKLHSVLEKFLSFVLHEIDTLLYGEVLAS